MLRLAYTYIEIRLHTSTFITEVENKIYLLTMRDVLFREKYSTSEFSEEILPEGDKFHDTLT